MSTAAKNLTLLVYFKATRSHTWNDEAEETLRLIAANLIAGNY